MDSVYEVNCCSSGECLVFIRCINIDREKERDLKRYYNNRFFELPPKCSNQYNFTILIISRKFFPQIEAADPYSLFIGNRRRE